MKMNSGTALHNLFPYPRTSIACYIGQDFFHPPVKTSGPFPVSKFAVHFGLTLLSDHRLPANDPLPIRCHGSYTGQPAFWEPGLLLLHPLLLLKTLFFVHPRIVRGNDLFVLLPVAQAVISFCSYAF